MSTEMTGAQILVESLAEQGVDTLFGYPGGTVLDIFDAVYDKRDQIRLVLTAHEQGAVHAADGYARSTGRTGVVLATSGPGATNLVTGIAAAYLDSVPLVAVTGNVPTDLMGRDGFQEVNITEITRPIVKRNFLVREAADMAETVRQAFAIANSGRKRPTLIDVPKDVSAMQAEFSGAARFAPAPEVLPSPEDLDVAAQYINRAERPLIYAGGGVTFSESSGLLLALSQKISAPVCVSMMGLSSVPGDYAFFLGMVGMHGTPTANMAVRECDVLIAVGARFSDRVAGNRTHFAENARVVHLDVDSAELSKNVRADAALVGHMQQTIPALLERLEPRRNADWLHGLLRHKVYNALPLGISERLTPHDIIAGLRHLLGDSGIVATDVGQHQLWTAQHYRFARPRTFLSSCGLGAMGYGMGAAIGAQVGNPDLPVALVTGDGSFHMNLNELATAVSQNLPIIVLVFNNRVLGMVHQWQALFYGKRYAHTELNRATDYVKLAGAFGAEGHRIEHKKDIAAVLAKALRNRKPCVIDCVIDAAERVFPIIPPGSTGKDMIFND